MLGLKLNRNADPTLAVSVIPIVFLLTTLITMIAVVGSDAVQNYSYYILGTSSVVCLLLGCLFPHRRKCIIPGIAKSARQILPAVPILFFIGTLSATWMLSGVVPVLIDYGLTLINPHSFLFIACVTCALVAVVSGSSWTTIATVGVALMGVGSVMGYHVGWVAGAIISGAYFGDKISPMSDTTVLTASTCGVHLLSHVRSMMVTSLPAMGISLCVYLAVGFLSDLTASSHAEEMIVAINRTFNITPMILIIPAITVGLIAFRVGTATTLAVGSLVGLAGIWVFQPQMVDVLCGGDSQVWTAVKILFTSTDVRTGSALLDPLVSTGGVEGMLPTVWLVLSAMIFGGVMIGTGMLGTITHSITSRIRRPGRLVGTTVASGIFLNSCTGDQYLSIIIGGNVYKNTYRRLGIKLHTLSRTIEDSTSVTSVLIPWNSCGVTQATVLGVPTLIYLPFCLFNLFSPVMTMIMAWTGWGMRMESRPVEKPNE